MKAIDNGRRRARALFALAVWLAASVWLLVAGTASAAEPLRVCADPNNLPYSDKSGAGFENALAELVSTALGDDGVSYTWRPQRRGFVRNTLGAHLCDVIMGVPLGYELAATTKPYYYSTYVFVTRTGGGLSISTIDDPALRKLRIGVPAVGDDYASTPGEAALGKRGIIDNVVAYSIYGDYSKPHPPSNLIEAVAAGDIDVAIAWGPLAGYFASREAVPLTVTPVSPHVDPPFPFVFGIAMGVRHGDDVLRERLNSVIAAHAADIHRLLEQYAIPLVDASVARQVQASLAPRVSFSAARPAAEGSEKSGQTE
ncbi:MAG TPA: substrate-binding domain-containing protein [Gammaproteobacteria bacterium]|nr:substrate-binding domain-containing protein [Gammaproteobacteria bacterium]